MTRKAVPMDGLKQVVFDPYKYLASPGIGRRLIRFKAKHVLFSQGTPADAVFYIHSGRAKLTVVSKRGKEATVTLLAAGDFVGEESTSEPCRLHSATACAITACVVLKIDSAEMLRIMHAEHEFSDLFLKFMVARSIRIQADLVDQFQRTASGANTLADGRIWPTWGANSVNCSHHAGDAGGNDRYDSFARQLLHEPVPEARLYPIQRAHSRS